MFLSAPSKICGKQPLKNLKGYGLPSTNLTWLTLEYFVPNNTKCEHVREDASSKLFIKIILYNKRNTNSLYLSEETAWLKI